MRREALMIALGIGLGWTASRLVIPTPAVGYLSPRVLLPGPVRVRVPMIVNARWGVLSDLGKWCEPSTGQWTRRPVWSAGPAEVVCRAPGAAVRLLVQGPSSDSRLVDPSISFEPEQKEKKP